MMIPWWAVAGFVFVPVAGVFMAVLMDAVAANKARQRLVSRS